MLERKAEGQSSVELLVSAAVIVPIVLLLPTLANMLLLQTETHKAARYVAWERVAYPEGALKSGEDLAQEVEDRFFRFGKQGFSGAADVGNQLAPWQDWGRRVADRQAEAGSLVQFESSVSARVDATRSATANHFNTSSYLAGRGGVNAVQLNTLQSSEISIPLRSENSLLQLAATPLDPVSGDNRFYLRSSSALVVDSWAPVNERVYYERVSDIGGRDRGFLGFYQNTGITRGLSGVFDEISDHLYVNTPGTESPFDMVDPNQSSNLPTYITDN